MNCRICNSKDNKYNIFEDEVSLGEGVTEKLIYCLNQFFESPILEADELSPNLCEHCANKLYDSYMFLCQARASESGFKEDVKEEDDMIEILNTELSDVESIEAEEEIEVIPIINTNEFLRRNKVCEPDNKKQKCTVKEGPGDSKLCTPIKIITPHFYFNFLENSDGKIVKRINVTTKERVLDENDEYDYELNVGTEEENVMIQCKYCEKAFTIEYHALVHLRKSHMCSICLLCFKHCSDLNVHVRTHIDFQCIYCDHSKYFSTNALYKGHLKKFHGIGLPAHLNLVEASCIEKLNTEDVLGQ